ncbi:MAG: restriction endonuclease subunit S, partial [Prevotella sp.]|nr:restriction endonuclease subunit S [Prevotella sp.]
KLENNIEGILYSVVAEPLSLNEIAPFVTKSIKLDEILIDTYVTTDNMLQNKSGVIPFEGVANISSITEYKKNDILISNIRPYLKKIWFADKDGGCSKDVLVLRSSAPDKYNPKYIYYMLRRDTFFDYVMKSTKGIKMPRGNKSEILKYEIPVPTIQQERDILSSIEKLENEIINAKTVISQAPQLKQAVLDKYL